MPAQLCLYPGSFGYADLSFICTPACSATTSESDVHAIATVEVFNWRTSRGFRTWHRVVCISLLNQLAITTMMTVLEAWER